MVSGLNWQAARLTLFLILVSVIKSMGPLPVICHVDNQVGETNNPPHNYTKHAASWEDGTSGS